MSAELAVRHLAANLYKAPDSIEGLNSRDICVTPYDGAYGRAGYVVAINGSPPRGTFVTVAYGYVVYIESDGRARRMLPSQARIVTQFLREKGYEVKS